MTYAPAQSRIERLRGEAREAPHITLHIDAKGAASCSFGGLRWPLHTGDEVEAVTRVIIERLHDPDAPTARTNPLTDG